MATELTVQSERAFQKQPHIFTAQKVRSSKRRVGKGGRRWFKDVGLGFKTPKTAIEGSYIGTSSEALGFFAEVGGQGSGCGGQWRNCGNGRRIYGKFGGVGARELETVVIRICR